MSQTGHESAMLAHIQNLIGRDKVEAFVAALRNPATGDRLSAFLQFLAAEGFTDDVLIAVVLVLAESVHSGLQAVFPERYVKRRLRPSVIGALIHSRADRKIVRPACIMGRVVVVKRGNRQNDLFIEYMYPGERRIAIRLALGIAQCVTRRVSAGYQQLIPN